MKVARWISLLLVCAISAASEPRSGLTVLEVKKGSGEDSAGIRPGDVLEKWRLSNRIKAELSSSFDLFDVELNQCPRGMVTLIGKRGGHKRIWELRSVIPGEISVRPALSRDLLFEFQEALKQVESGNLRGSGQLLLDVARKRVGFKPTFTRAWILSYAATTFARAHQWDETDRTFRDALEAATPGRPRVTLSILLSWSSTWRARHNWNGAENVLKLALDDVTTHKGSDLARAFVIDSIGQIELERGDLVKARQSFELAYRMTYSVAPKGSLAAAAGEHLGLVLSSQGDQPAAIKYFRESLAVREQLQPEGMDVALSYGNIGVSGIRSGDLPAAESNLRQSIAILRRLAPETTYMVKNLGNIGTVLRDRGDLTGAEESFREAKVLAERLEPDGPTRAYPMMNLGVIAYHRGDLDKAEGFLRQALTIYEKLQPGSLQHSACLVNLGNVLQARFELEDAQRGFAAN
jgi:tetratricopeptide (TPR) repeat protein